MKNKLMEMSRNIELITAYSTDYELTDND